MTKELERLIALELLNEYDLTIDSNDLEGIKENIMEDIQKRINDYVKEVTEQ